MLYNQQEFDIKLEWGLKGLHELQPVSDVVIIVDVLSFSTCVDIVTANGASVYPYRWKDESAIAYAREIDAVLADFKRKYTGGYSLSPVSLSGIPSNSKLVLPSPNGSAISFASKGVTVLCACLRNAAAVAKYAQKLGRRISFIPAGEQWPDASLRVAFEDLIGAGAVISYLEGDLSPESKVALAAFENTKTNLFQAIRSCGSGKELLERGFEKDILLACELNASANVPVLKDNAYIGKQNN